jgi:hypothetical protein
MTEEVIHPLKSKFNLHYIQIQFAPHREQNFRRYERLTVEYGIGK